jgi:hypothetical protein
MRTGFWLFLALAGCGSPAAETPACADAAKVDAWTDADGDGAGDPATKASVCALAADQVDNGDDCDDANANIFPSAPEACDGVDEDCDGVVDNGLASSTWYSDSDGDGFGDPTAGVDACAPPPGAIADSSDCDDTRADISPAADEVCDGIDNDCNTFVDADDAGLDVASELTFYGNHDHDGFGDDDAIVQGCVNPDPTHYEDVGGDCDDSDAQVFPRQVEICNNIDDNCDTLVDGDDPLLDPATLDGFYVDADQDGVGDETQPVQACFRGPGLAVGFGDCDDNDPGIGAAPMWRADGDGDGFGAGMVVGPSCTMPAPDSIIAGGPQDCDDADAAISPGALEVCDLVDNDCDGQVDDADPSLDPAGAGTFFHDSDSDGFGAGAAVDACVNPDPTQYILIDGDCNDAVATVYPGAPEVCDGLDDDCDTLVDLADGDLDPNTLVTLYRDLDNDGVGDSAFPIQGCEPGQDLAAVGGDCDDNDPTQGAPQVWVLDGDADGVGAGAPLGPESCVAPQPDAVPQTIPEDCADADPAIHPGAVDACGDGIDQDCSGADAACMAIGSYFVSDGPGWATNPPVYSCLEACALVFGGVAADYHCSTSAVVEDFQAYESGWGDGLHCAVPVPEDYSKGAGGYDCGFFGCSYSAYVADHCAAPLAENFCWAN